MSGVQAGWATNRRVHAVEQRVLCHFLALQVRGIYRENVVGGNPATKCDEKLDLAREKMDIGIGHNWG